MDQDEYLERLRTDVANMGLRRGDDVLARLAQRNMAKPPVGTGAQALCEAIVDVIGPEGTLLVLTFSAAPVLKPWARRPLFTQDSEALTGKFPNYVMKHPNAIRSTHPTNSFAAIGPSAHEYLRFHTPASFSFAPIETLVAKGGHMMMVGCTEESPGFSTVHLAQYHLGLSYRTILSKRTGADYLDFDGSRKTFRKPDVPGCSAGFSRLYPMYRAHGLLREGEVGGAATMAISAPEAYALELETVRSDPTSVLCLNPDCFSCRASLYYQIQSWPGFWRRRALKKIKSRRSAPGLSQKTR